MTKLPRQSRGFTLLEVVVALTVAAMLMVVVYNAVHLGIRAHRAIAARIDDNDGTRVLSYFLRRQFRRVDTSAAGEGLRFSGGPHGVRCALRGFRGDPSTYTLSLRALPEPNPSRLVASLQRVDARSGRPLSAALTSEIASGLHGIHFAFFGDTGSGAGPLWEEHWRARGHPPRLLRVSYVDKAQRGQNLYLPVAGADGNQVARYAAGGADF